MTNDEICSVVFLVVFQRKHVAPVRVQAPLDLEGRKRLRGPPAVSRYSSVCSAGAEGFKIEDIDLRRHPSREHRVGEEANR